MQVLEAIGKNDPQALKAALAAGGDPNTIDKAGAPALLHAIDTGSMDLVRALVDAGAHLEGRDNIGWTALMAAAAADADALVAYLLRAGANPNHVGREDTPLTCAITDASLKVIQLLLDHGAEPDLRRPDGWTPLMLGAFRGDLNILGALLAQGADATVTLGLRLTDAATIAAANGHAQAATLLLEAADASHPAPSELWSAIKSWAEQKAPPLAARFVPADSEARMPESWGVLPTDAQLQLTKWAPGLPFYDYLGLDLPTSITIWQELCDQAEAGDFVGKKVMRLGQDEPVERQYWCEGWVPIARDAEGNLLVIDLAPRPNGIRGQFVSWSRQEGPLSVLGSSITPWLRNYLHEIRRERVRYDPRTESLIQSTL